MRPPAIVGKWPKRGVTFHVERGSFLVPVAVLQRAEVSGDDFEIRRAFAMHLAEHDEARPYRYERRRDGLHVYWRSIRVIAADRGRGRTEDSSPGTAGRSAKRIQADRSR